MCGRKKRAVRIPPSAVETLSTLTLFRDTTMEYQVVSNSNSSTFPPSHQREKTVRDDCRYRRRFVHYNMRAFFSGTIHSGGMGLMYFTVGKLFVDSDNHQLSTYIHDLYVWDCDPNRNVWFATPSIPRPDMKSLVYLLSVTNVLGNISYPVAKAVDVCWDLVFGRVSQALFAFLHFWYTGCSGESS